MLLLSLLGLCFGSFVEATSWRLHEQSIGNKRTVKQTKDLSITTGRSMCSHCRHTLAWYDLLPLLSWLSLAGKCRYCQIPIGWHAPLLELAMAGLFVASYVWWPLTLGNSVLGWVLFAVWLVLLIGLLLLALYDLRWMLLPNRVVYPLQVVAVVFAGLSVRLDGTGFKGGVDTLLAVGVIAGLFWVLYQLSDGAWIGGGDARLGVILGLIVGSPLKAALVLFVASFAGSIVGVPTLIIGKQGRMTKLPFGPFLIMATYVVFLFGAGWISWYKTRFLTF